MESLSNECTGLKHRYDSCFNLWFEGYLQPALDHADRMKAFKPSPVEYNEPESSESIKKPPTKSDSQPPRIITNWSNAFRPREADMKAQVWTQISSLTSLSDTSPPEEFVAVDTKGKSRAQIKAEEYERACGESWRQYQACVTNAIAQNSSLSTLLQQARDEHPLRSQDGLKGSVWDPATKPTES